MGSPSRTPTVAVWTGEEETALSSGIRELGRLRTEGTDVGSQRSTNYELSRFYWSTDLFDADGGTEEEGGEGESWLEVEVCCHWVSVSSVGV